MPGPIPWQVIRTQAGTLTLPPVVPLPQPLRSHVFVGEPLVPTYFQKGFRILAKLTSETHHSSGGWQAYLQSAAEVEKGEMLARNPWECLEPTLGDFAWSPLWRHIAGSLRRHVWMGAVCGSVPPQALLLTPHIGTALMHGGLAAPPL